MTKEKIEERKNELLTQIEQVKNQFQALTGAIQDCDYWLEQIGNPKEKKK